MQCPACQANAVNFHLIIVGGTPVPTVTCGDCGWTVTVKKLLEFHVSGKMTELWTHFPDGRVIVDGHMFKRRHAVGQNVRLNSKSYRVTRDIVVEHVWVE